jgi:thioesterase domain-containing protein
MSAQEKAREVDAADLLDYRIELPAYRQRMVEAHWQAITHYIAKPYDKPVLLLQAQAQPLLSTERPEAAWQKLAIGQLTVVTIPGSHEGMFKEPHVQTLARELSAQIDTVQGAMSEM